MSNRTNHRRGDSRRTENGSGYNSTHVAKARTKWKKLLTRKSRRESSFTRKDAESVKQSTWRTCTNE